MIDGQAVLDVVIPLGASAVLGGSLGFERELRGRWAGLRTHMLVAIGAAMFVLAGVHGSPGSPLDITRVIQGITAGIGFIGAGTILKLTDRLEVKGLTTASSIWLAAAIGTAAGIKQYVLAVTGAVVAVVVLAVLGQLEKRLERFREPRDSA
jgi:putative Mg2+ transporter-C (MgtC) family protein